MMILAATVVAVYQLCWVPLECDLRLRGLEQSTRLTAEAMTGFTERERNVAELTRLTARCRCEVNAFVLLGLNYWFINRYQSASRSYRIALEIDRRPEIYFNLGNAEYAAGNRGEAIRAFALACRFDPSFCAGFPVAITDEMRGSLTQIP